MGHLRRGRSARGARSSALVLADQEPGRNDLRRQPLRLGGPDLHDHAHAHPGREYVVWDKASTIRFRTPGRTTLFATFLIAEAEIDAIRQFTAAGEPVDRVYQVDLVDGQGVVHASVEKTIYVRRKTPAS